MSTYRELAGNGEVAAENARYMAKVYMWMAFALTLTASVAGGLAMWLGNAPLAGGTVSAGMIKVVFFVCLLLEFGLVVALAGWVMRMPLSVAVLLFCAYALFNGVTLSVIFMAYTLASVIKTLLITTALFAIMAAYGYFTRTDLTSVGSILFIGLIGIILGSVVNWFLHSPLLDYIITYAGIIVFLGLTAYDNQKIKELNIIGNEGTAENEKEAIRGALTLYLDFINLFLMLLRLFGRRR